MRSQKTLTSINKGTGRDFLDKEGMNVCTRAKQETIC